MPDSLTPTAPIFPLILHPPLPPVHTFHNTSYNIEMGDDRQARTKTTRDSDGWPSLPEESLCTLIKFAHELLQHRAAKFCQGGGGT